MGFDRRVLNLPIVAAAATTSEATFNLRSEYVRPLGFSFVTAVGSEANAELRMTDGDGRVFYKDAAGVDYSGTAIYRQLGTDDVTTGTTPMAYDSVGVLAATAQVGPMPVVRNPIRVDVSSATATDAYVLTFEYEYGCFNAMQFVLPTAASTTSTLTKSLNAKYAQILGFRSLSVGTSTTSRLEIKDADGKIVYLDAADKNYDAAELDKVLLLDATVTGLTRVVPFNNTAAGAQANIGVFQPPLVRSPLTLTATSQDGNDEVQTTTVYYKTG